ncbi:MAG TPA: sulfurtransferase [Cellvibrio sp.]|nr:sulfurtransferase [Cellvibrio sp.]
MINSVFISASELHSQLGKDTVVFDCRFSLLDKAQGFLEYRQGHLPGAYYLDLEKDLSSPLQTHGGRHPLPNINQLENTLRRAGVYQHTKVVLYDDSRFAYAARAWWLLRYMGHQQVYLLDGGFKAWVAFKGALDKREPALKSGNFKANIQHDWVVNRDALLQTQAITLIDSREARRFQGLEEPIDPVAGHIPNAVNYPWQEVSDTQGFVRPLEEQKARWSNLDTTKEIVVYCGSGVTACVNILALHLCGIDSKLYPGSWSDWCSYLAETEARQKARLKN